VNVNGWVAALVVVAGLAVSAVGGWALTKLVLHLASRSPDAGRPAPPGPDGAVLLRAPLRASDGPEGPGARAVLRGGTWIGILERLATTAALAAGQPALLAVVVAVKGLGRYPELRDNPGASERFVVGTLASLLWAAAVGLGLRWLLTG
jgi:hypothetical protein